MNRKTFKRKCALCGAEFETTAHNARFCSVKCQRDDYRKDKPRRITKGSEALKMVREENDMIKAARRYRREQMLRHLKERDAAYAAAFPDLVGGSVRGRINGGACQNHKRF